MKLGKVLISHNLRFSFQNDPISGECNSLRMNVKNTYFLDMQLIFPPAQLLGLNELGRFHDTKKPLDDLDGDL